MKHDQGFSVMPTGVIHGLLLDLSIANSDLDYGVILKGNSLRFAFPVKPVPLTLCTEADVQKREDSGCGKYNVQ